jgi:phosphopantothenoylcysteine decarboxylase/phosphopantothenate--cysteine ligase
MKGRKIIIGISGSIAAYKSALLVRLLVEAGAEVKVIFTPSAHAFVTPLTFSTLSGNPVETHLSDEHGNWNNHIKWGLWADLLLIAPLSANTLSKMVNGSADNLLTAVYLSARCKVMVAPAMDLDMFRHPAVQNNLDLLKQRGVDVIPSPAGFLASGLHGEGRMEEPDQIFARIRASFESAEPWKGKTILVTAGPTHEKIDPVRFIGNYSSGKMGLAIAEAFLAAGAEVKLVYGPGVKVPQRKGLESFPVTGALEMQEHCQRLLPSCSGVVMAAAVADYRPRNIAEQKVKKEDGKDAWQMELVKNPDILAGLSESKKPGQFLIGFALETENGMLNAKEKLKKKKLDFIVLNTHDNIGSGFGHDTNAVTLIAASGQAETFPLMKKTELANKLVNRWFELLHEHAE